MYITLYEEFGGIMRREPSHWNNDYSYSWREQERRARREWWIENLTIVGCYLAVVAIATCMFIKLSA